VYLKTGYLHARTSYTLSGSGAMYRVWDIRVCAEVHTRMFITNVSADAQLFLICLYSYDLNEAKS